MREAEEEFKYETSENVYFGIGSFGSNETMNGIGACYRMKIDNVDKDLIV